MIYQLHKKPDLIILTECWITDCNMAACCIAGYNRFWCSGSNKNGGIIIFSNIKTIKVSQDYKNFLDCCDSLALKFDSGILKDQVIIAVYRSPSERTSSFVNSLLEHVRSFTNDSSTILAVVGDFNMCLNKYTTDGNVENLYDSMLEKGFSHIMQTNTRITFKSQSLIDQIFMHNYHIHSATSAISAGNIRADITDHDIQYLYMTMEKKSEDKSKPVRNYEIKNIDHFQKLLDNLNIVINEDAHVNEMFEDFLKSTNTAYLKAFPLKPKSNKMRKSKSWFNDECLKAFRMKTKLFKRYKKTLLIQDRLISDEYNRYYRKLLKHTKQNYFSDLISQNTSQKAKWKTINTILGNKMNERQIKIRNSEGEIVDEKEAPNILNKYFNEVGLKFGSESDSRNDYLLYLRNSEPTTMFFEEFSENEIRMKVLKLESRRSSNDLIPLRFFKLYPNTLFETLTNILNKSVKLGVMPDKLKTSNIVPIFKKGSRSDPTNYRPISLLSYIDKILEKAVYSRVYSYLTKTKFFCNNQFGFRAKHSTEHAILSLMDRIYKHLNSKEYVILLSLDLTKAFDVIRHDILLKKLENAGLRGTILAWFQSYLNKRQHRTTVNGYSSNYLTSTVGVPQGSSSLGPLLFLIYINDLKNVINEDKLNVFADDTTILLHDKNPHKLVISANENLVILDKFFKANAVNVNESKTQYMFLCPKGMKIDLTEKLTYRNSSLSEADHIKFLGVYIDKNLTFARHTEHLIMRLRRYLSLFYRLRGSIPRQQMIMLYFAHVHSIISYCILVYGRGNSGNLERLNRLQNRILRIIFPEYFTSKDLAEIRSRFRICSPKVLLQIKTLLLAHKIIYNVDELPHFFINKYSCKKELNLRNKLDFITPYYRTNLGQRSIDYCVSKEWNCLPPHLKSQNNHRIFKMAIRQWLNENKEIL